MARRNQRLAESRECNLVIGASRDRLQDMVGRHALHDSRTVEPDDVELRVATLGGNLAKGLAGAAGFDHVDRQPGLRLKGLRHRSREIERIVENQVSGRDRRH